MLHVGGTTQTEAGGPSSPRHATSCQSDVAKSGHPSARPAGTRVENGHPRPTRAAAAGQAGGRRGALALFSRGKGARGDLGRPEGLPPSSHLASY